MTARTPRLVETVSGDEGRALTVVVAVPGHGTARTTYGWDSPEEARHHHQSAVEAALREAARMATGETRNVTRHATRWGTLYVGVLGGPPTWYWPRVGARRGEHGYFELMVGWWRRALVVGWSRRERCRPSKNA